MTVLENSGCSVPSSARYFLTHSESFKMNKNFCYGSVVTQAYFFIDHAPNDINVHVCIKTVMLEGSFRLFLIDL